MLLTNEDRASIARAQNITDIIGKKLIASKKGDCDNKVDLLDLVKNIAKRKLRSESDKK